MSEQNGPIESKAQFPETPAGRQQYWTVEIGAARDNVKDWHADGEKVIKEFLGERTDTGKQRLNLFFADVTTKEANMSGVPKVRARRRFADALDDVARVSADALERLLNTDIDREEDGYRKSLTMARGDWLKPGLGVVRYRYVADFETVPAQEAQTDPETGEELAPAVPETERKSREDVETDYVFWKDFLWSPCRTWSEARWVAFRAEMTRDQLIERFGEEKAASVNLSKRTPKEVEGISEQIKDAWSRAEVWEVWSKESKTRIMFAEGMSEILEEVPDPLGLPNFFPCPEPLCANVTTSKWIPRPFYFLAEDLYNEVHDLTRRIRNIVKGIKNVGGYDSTCPELGRMLDEACENQLIPVKNWNMLKEKGGLAGAAELLPIKERVDALVALVQQRNLVKQDLYEITASSDLTRGQSPASKTATAARGELRMFASRVQAVQGELARFASEGQRIRAALIAKHFDPETIISRSNIDKAVTIDQPMPSPAPGMPPAGPPQKVPDRKLIDAAVQLLKDDFSGYRVEVEADSLSMTDFDAVQQDAVAFMAATSQFFQQWTPLIQMGGPPIAKFALELYQQFAAQLRGAERFEGVIDRAIAELEQAAAAPKPPPPPNPQVEKAKIDLTTKQIEAKAKVAETQMDMQAATAKHQMDMQKMTMQQQTQRQNFGMRMAEVHAQQASAADVEPPGVE